MLSGQVIVSDKHDFSRGTEGDTKWWGVFKNHGPNAVTITGESGAMSVSVGQTVLYCGLHIGFEVADGGVAVIDFQIDP